MTTLDNRINNYFLKEYGHELQPLETLKIRLSLQQGEVDDHFISSVVRQMMYLMKRLMNVRILLFRTSMIRTYRNVSLTGVAGQPHPMTWYYYLPQSMETVLDLSI